MMQPHILLRAVARTVTGADVLYTAAAMLTPGRLTPSESAAGWVHNRAVCIMAAHLLGLPDTDPEIMERVLRDLPEQETKEGPS